MLRLGRIEGNVVEGIKNPPLEVRLIIRKKTRKKISSDELTEVLQVVHKKSFIDEGDKEGWYNLELTRPFLDSKGLLDHIVIHQPRGDELRHLIKRSSIYDTHNLLFRNLDIELKHPWDLDEDFVWTSDPLWVQWHFEHCLFHPSSPNMESIVFGWRGNFRFHKNEFDFGDSKEMRSWVFAFRHGSRVRLQGHDFRESHLQISHTLSHEHDLSATQTLSWENRTARIVKDRSYYETMIRKKYIIPETVRLHMPDLGPWRPGLASLSFLGNRGIDSLQLECNAAYYDFRGMNCISSLRFRQLGTVHDDEAAFAIYFGAREKIDPHFGDPHNHRRMFLTLREIAAKRQDSRIASNFDKQIDRIDYFLTKEQKISLRADWRGWIEYWQDRILYEWRRLSSDYYRSWLIPLMMFLLGYLILNAFPWFCIEQFTVHHWLEFSLRPINRMPFYTAELQGMLRAEYETLSNGAIVLLRLIGFVQVIWIALWGFAFGRSVKR